ncbi:MAG: quinoprotein dehydrogenase-associated SoxYZ-like carrier [Hyphomicrobiaceae bacterium]|nr:quinoprotein dehydrogenase-associated SoxYZ-like carrier [Hyphomicrobiaceae bacterium]
MRRPVMSICLALLGPGMAAAAEPALDPLNSPVWPSIRSKYLSGGPVVFDDRVKVSVPSIVENQAQVPITADARNLPGVKKLVIVADLNPIQHILTLTPAKASAYISFRMKVEQGTPVRAAAQTEDGVWHVGGTYLSAAGGGCSAPALARGEARWSATVGQAQGKVWRQPDGSARVRLRVRHPMDTGLARNNTPAYFIESLQMSGSSRDPLATLELFEPVSEDPTVTLMLRLPATDASVDVEGRDNNGGIYKSSLPVAPQS